MTRDDTRSTGAAGLEIVDLHRAFGGVHAVRGASFRVPRGRITGLIGPNGAGKTTVFDLVSGRIQPQRGKVIFGSSEITGLRPDVIARLGLVRTFQVPRPFMRMSVWENLLYAAPDQPGERFWRGMIGGQTLKRREAEIGTRADEVLTFLQLGDLADQPAEALSGGQRKLLELGRALMLEPKMILLDEPTAGVAPELTNHLVEHLRALRDRGTSLLVIEHDLDLVMKLVDHLVVMHLGETLVQGTPAEARADPRVLDAYLGGVHA